jgi:4-amino-4-deoxy-L-arabinose transferase-like glycosyltransferase
MMIKNADQVEQQLTKHKLLFFLILFLLFCSVSLTGLNGSLQNKDETNYANISRESLEAGSLIPLKNGEYHVHKSPMVYWTAMVSFKLFGVNDFSAKLPSALANIISAFIIFFFTKMIFQSYLSGIFASFIYMTSIQVYGSSHQLAADSIMVMTILCSLYFSAKALHEKKWWILLAAFFNALTILTKSIIGLAVPATLLVYIVLQKRWSDLWYFLIFVVMSLSIALPYFLYAYVKAPELFIETFLKTNLMRRVASENAFAMARVMKIFRNGLLYILLLLAVTIPFTPVMFFVFRRKKMEKSLKEMVWNPQSKILTIYFIIIWIVFSLGKRLWPHYALSAIPILAIYLGETLSGVKDRKIFIYLAAFAFFTISIFLIWVSREIDRYPTYRDVVLGLFIMYVLFIGYAVTFYFMKGDINVKLLFVTTIFFIVFSITTAIIVPLDFNADIKSFREVIFQKSNTLVIINTKEVDEGHYKIGATKWYLRMDAKQYRTLDVFIPDAKEYTRGTYYIYYYKYTDTLKEIYDTFTVLKTGKVWNLGVTM